MHSLKNKSPYTKMHTSYNRPTVNTQAEFYSYFKKLNLMLQ